MSRMFSLELLTATPADCNARWSCGKPGENFRCGFCGHKFKQGDLWRGLYTNDLQGAGGNPLVCETCNASNQALRVRWQEKSAVFNAMRKSDEWWWFNKGLVYA